MDQLRTSRWVDYCLRQPIHRRKMATPERNDRQQFTGHSYGDLELYEIVREVALLACRPGRDPRRVTQARWDAALERSRWPDAPAAKEMCVQLHDTAGKPWSWRALQAGVFSGKSLARVHMARLSVDDDLGVDSERAFYAVRRVAAFRGEETLGPLDYVAGRDALLAEHRRKWKHVSKLEALSPTLNQLLTAAQGDWTLVLEWAELEERTERRDRRLKARPYTDAVISYWQDTGLAPRSTWLTEYAFDRDFSMQTRSKVPHEEMVDQARQLARERGLGEMPPIDRKAKRPLWSTASGRREGEARPQVRLSSVRAVTAMREFLGVSRQRKRSPSLNYSQALQTDPLGPYAHWPSSTALRERGSWPELRRQAVRPNALERAAVEDLAFARERKQRRAQRG